jgi:hypothetical protein
MHEGSAMAPLGDHPVDELTADFANYGPLKALCETAVEADDAVIYRALKAGLRFRPLADTIRATLDEAEPTDNAGLTPEHEADLLATWHAR